MCKWTLNQSSYDQFHAWPIELKKVGSSMFWPSCVHDVPGFKDILSFQLYISHMKEMHILISFIGKEKRFSQGQ